MRGNKLNWPAIVKTKLAPLLQGFAARGRLVFESPVDDILCAFQVEVSAFTSSAAHIECFVLPLYVPHDHLSFNFGVRLGQPGTGVELWEVDDHSDVVLSAMAQVMDRDGRKFLNKIRTPADLAKYLSTDVDSLQDPHTMEALAYSQVLAGETDHAKRSMESVLGTLDLSINWEREMLLRLTLIHQFTLSHDLDSARSQLATWRRYSMEKLRIA